LRGDEIRACWEASTVPVEVAPTPGEHRPIAPLHVVEDRTPVRKLEFVEVGSSSGNGFEKPYAGRGVAFADFDNDGFLDILLVNGDWWPSHPLAGARPAEARKALRQLRQAIGPGVLHSNRTVRNDLLDVRRPLLS